MDDRTLFEQAADKGNTFLASNNFSLAKQAFVTALRVRDDPILRGKVVQCDQGIAQQKKKEAIKKGRRLEKKGKWAEALLCFEQAATWEKEAWISDRIAALRQKATLSSVVEEVHQAEQSDDLESKIAAYDRILTLRPDPITVNRKAACLFQQHRHVETVTLYATHPPNGDRGYYLAGLAYAYQERYGEAWGWWGQVMSGHDLLRKQQSALLPFVYRELRDMPPGPQHVAVYRILHRLQTAWPDPSLAPYEAFFKARTMDVWWVEGHHDELLEHLQPLPETFTLPWLGWYARLFFKLAWKDVRHLETAIPLWLTAIYQDALLTTLSTQQVLGTEIDLQALRMRLMQAMERLLSSHERNGVLPDGIRALWRWEKRSIEALAPLPTHKHRPEPFPCTPGFANRFGLAVRVFDFLQECPIFRDTNHDEALQELLAGFSPSGPALAWLERGEEEKALAHLATNTRDELSEYCRQRVNWTTAIKTLKNGGKPVKKQLMGALPLIRAYPAHAEELVQLAFDDLKTDALIELEEVMEILIEQIESPEFREATAYLMGIKALRLLHTMRKSKHRNYQGVIKLLERAEAIHGDAEAVKTAREQYQKITLVDRFETAIHKQNVARATQVVQESGDPDMEELFFTAMQSWSQQMANWNLTNRLATLREIYSGCLRLDQHHPVTQSLGIELENLEKKR